MKKLKSCRKEALTRKGGLLENFRAIPLAVSSPIKKGYNSIHLLPGKVGKMRMTAFRNFGERPTVPGPNPNRTNFFTPSEGLGEILGGYFFSIMDSLATDELGPERRRGCREAPEECFSCKIKSGV